MTTYDIQMLESDGFTVGQGDIITLTHPMKLVKEMLKNNIILAIDKDSEEIYIYRNNVYERISEDELKSILTHYIEKKYPDLWRPSFESQYFSALKNVLPRKKMNANKRYLTVKNGILDLQKQKLLKHNPNLFSTIKVDICYDEKAKAQKFKQFLKDISCDDVEMIRCLEEILGYCLTTSTKASKLFILYGEGSNGKSTFLNLIKKLIGKENVQSIPLKDFEKSFTRNYLRDVLVNVISEGDLSTRKTLISDTVKNFVTGEDVSGEVKGGQIYTYTPILKIILATNRLPAEISSISYGEIRRILILPFKQRFSGNGENKNLSAELEAELSGILNIALKGFRRLKKNNYMFSYEKKSKAFLHKYLSQKNPLPMFVEQYVEENYASRIYYKDAFSAFSKYCEENDIENFYNEDTFSLPFKTCVEQRFHKAEICRSNTRRGIKDFRLKD